MHLNHRVIGINSNFDFSNLDHSDLIWKIEGYY
jgi:hypothetical protein